MERLPNWQRRCAPHAALRIPRSARCASVLDALVAAPTEAQLDALLAAALLAAARAKVKPASAYHTSEVAIEDVSAS